MSIYFLLNRPQAKVRKTSIILEIDDLGGFAAILRFPMPEVENDGSD